MDHGSTKDYGFIGKSLILSFSSAGGTHLGLVALRCTQVCELLGSYNPTPLGVSFLKEKVQMQNIVGTNYKGLL
jgi:hypothetical protein